MRERDRERMREFNNKYLEAGVDVGVDALRVLHVAHLKIGKKKTAHRNKSMCVSCE
jgi:hypothetical protein